MPFAKICFALLLMLAADAYAAVCTSLKNGNFSSSSTWSCGRTPRTSDSVVIAHTVTLNGNYTITSLTINVGKKLLDDGNGNTLEATGNVINNGTFDSGGGILTLTSNNATLSGSGSFIDATVAIDATGISIPAGATLSFDTNSVLSVADNNSPASLTLAGTIQSSNQQLTDTILKARSGSTVTIASTGVINAPLSQISMRTGSALVNNGNVSVDSLLGRSGSPAPSFAQGATGTLSIHQTVCPTANPCSFNASAVGNTVNYDVGATVYPTNYSNVGGSVTCPLPNGVTINGTNPCGSQPPHHFQLDFAANALTCQPYEVTVTACANAACSSLHTTGSTGQVVIPSASFPNGASFFIPAGSSSTVVSAQSTTVGSYAVSASGGTNTSTCVGSCSVTVEDAGFLVSIPDHFAGEISALTVQAVKKSTNGNACVPAFTGTKPIGVSCSYSTPSAGTQPIVDNAGIACNGTNWAFFPVFNSSGSATLPFQYRDVGRLTFNISHSGTGSATGLAMSGSATVVVAPSVVALTVPTATKAGNDFVVTVTAKDAQGNTTPSFGMEGASVTLSSLYPSGTNPALVQSPQSFVSGVANNTVSWGEVGLLSIHGVLSSGTYLTSGLLPTIADVQLTVTPDHFLTTVSDSCISCLYSYSTQNIPFSVSAMNAQGVVTVNYAGGNACNVALSAKDAQSGVLGGLTAASILKAGWVNGQYSSTLKFTLPNASNPVRMYLYASEIGCSGTTTNNAGSTDVRLGKIQVSNSYGSELLDQTVSVTTKFFNNGWKVAVDDRTPVLAPMVSASTFVQSSVTPSAGVANFTLKKTGVPASITITPSSSYLATADGTAIFGVYSGNKVFIYRGRRGR